MESPEARVGIAEEESGRLKEYLGSLTAEDWSKPTACHRWTVDGEGSKRRGTEGVSEHPAEST